MHTSTPRRDTIAPLLARILLLATLHDYARVTLMDDGGATISLQDLLASRMPAVVDPSPFTSTERFRFRELARTNVGTNDETEWDEVGHKRKKPSGTRNNAVDEHKRDARDTAAAPSAAPAPTSAQYRLMRQAAARWRQLSVTARVIVIVRSALIFLSYLEERDHFEFVTTRPYDCSCVR